MRSEYKSIDLLKIQPFYTCEIQKKKKKKRVKKNVIKKPKVTNKQLLQALSFHPKKTRKLTKRRILENILPYFEEIAITKRERAFRGRNL